MNKNNAWIEVAEKVGGAFVKSDGRRPTGVRLRYKSFDIVLDSITSDTESSLQRVTRMRIMFFNESGLKLTIRKKGVFSKVVSTLGGKEIPLTDNELSSKISITSNNADFVKHFVSIDDVKYLLLDSKKILIRIPGQLKLGNDKIHLYSYLTREEKGIIKDVNTLVGWFELYKKFIDALFDTGITVMEADESMIRMYI